MTSGKPRILGICENRRARYHYSVEETFQAGLCLSGTEVKALRSGKASLQEAWIKLQEGEAFLQQAHISPYSHGNLENHQPLRPRKLLLRRSELRRLGIATREKGRSLVPLSLYFRGSFVKLRLALATGRKAHDKRQQLREREQRLEMARALKKL